VIQGLLGRKPQPVQANHSLPSHRFPGYSCGPRPVVGLDFRGALLRYQVLESLCEWWAAIYPTLYGQIGFHHVLEILHRQPLPDVGRALIILARAADYLCRYISISDILTVWQKWEYIERLFIYVSLASSCRTCPRVWHEPSPAPLPTRPSILA
jgi:hypothetical protein